MDEDLRSLARVDLPPAFQRWRLVLEPGAEQAADAGQWADALVLVERGTVEVECGAGRRRTFVEGDLLALGWLPLRRLRNPTPEVTRLLAVRRRQPRPAQAVSCRP